MEWTHTLTACEKRSLGSWDLSDLKAPRSDCNSYKTAINIMGHKSSQLQKLSHRPYIHKDDLEMPWMDSLQTASHVVQNRRDETQGPDWEKKSSDHKNGNFLFLFRRSSHVIVPRDRPSSKCPLANKIAKCGEILRLQKQWGIVILWLHTYWGHLRGENLFKMKCMQN